MEEKINEIIKKIKKTYNYGHDKGIALLESCLAVLRREKDERNQEETLNDKAFLERKRLRQLRNEELLRLKGYKLSRFKKPLPPLEERRQYIRFCKRCHRYYRTFSKHGDFCDKCKKGGVNDEVPKYLVKKEFKI